MSDNQVVSSGSPDKMEEPLNAILRFSVSSGGINWISLIVKSNLNRRGQSKIIED